MSAENWFVLNSGICDSPFNMAFDEALLEAMPRLGIPLLRFYAWREPAATFGYFQKYREVELLTPLRPLIRRPTGGGIVPHAHDWTYSVAFPPSHEWYSFTAVESYRRIHDWLRAAFAEIGIRTELALASIKAQPGQCFIGCERSDLLWSGQKVAGAAQRRRRGGLLIQGSVQPPRTASCRTDWERALCKVGSSQRGIIWHEIKQDDLLFRRADELAETKYSQPAYNTGR